ncbi:Holliday junction resolvase RuvX [Candidatus Saganbacteria bacterium]|nr:Holliday junction resolvase RuvX [Candidatus Saganbacteria bacterium]
MRILGIDYGDQRIGIAMSDPLGFTAQAVAVVGKGPTFEEDIKELKKIIKKFEGIDEIVVGLPKTMSGEVKEQAEKVLAFVEALKKSFKIPILTWDERLTTVLAERALREAGVPAKKRRGIVDKTAAGYILQSYLDNQSKR